MSADLSLWSLFSHASLLVQAVMGLLLAASLYSWTIIVQKGRALYAERRAADRFEKRFWSGIDLVEYYRDIVGGGEKVRAQHSGMAILFEAGFGEYARLRKQRAEAEVVMEGARRSMRVAMNREIDHLEARLSVLATIGSTSPYVGLFGTVWGIMNSFIALGEVQQATLQMVAPGIAEALIATAMGLFAAIPAVIAYNRYTNDVERLVNRLDTFLDEFSNLLNRQAHQRADAAA